MADKKKRVKKTAGVKQTAKQNVKQTVKIIVGDTGKKKATRRRPTTSKAGPSNIPPSFGGKSGVGTSDRVVIPPQSRADPSLYNKDALLSLQNQIKQLEYKADNAQMNLAGYLGNIMQNRLTYRNDASLEAPEKVIKEESNVKIEPGGPDVIEEDPITNKRIQRAVKKVSYREASLTGLSNLFQLPGTVGGDIGRSLSNQFQEQQINKGIATEKGQDKKQEMSQPKFTPIIGATSMPDKPIIYGADDGEGSKTPQLTPPFVPTQPPPPPPPLKTQPLKTPLKQAFSLTKALKDMERTAKGQFSSK